MVVSVHRQVKDALRARGTGTARHFHLPWMLLGPSAAPKEDSAVSPAELATVSPFILSGLFACAMLTCLRHPGGRHPMHPPVHLARAEHVYMRVGGQQKRLAAQYAGPYKVVAKGEKTFTIQVGHRQEKWSGEIHQLFRPRMHQ